MKQLLWIFCLCLPLAAQNHYSATTGDVSLSGAGTKLTIQQQAAGTKTLNLDRAVVYCSVACDVTQERNGTAASTTAGSVNKLDPGGASSQASIYTASNVGTGSTVGQILHLPATATAVLDLAHIHLPRGSTTTNYTVVISSITGTANITFYWSEPE